MDPAWHLLPLNQRILEIQLHTIFPQHNTFNNSRKDSAIKNPHTGKYLEVDVWLPDLNLCFEFQDIHHYKAAWYSQIPLNLVQQKDNIKKSEIRTALQTLIIVPQWWDGTAVSLKDTMQFLRPDLNLVNLDFTNAQIPINPPVNMVAERGQLMLASFPESDMIPSSWWVGEKWDGIRCFWHIKGQLYSRNNNAIDLPPSVNALFGPTVVDGELWCGRNFFREAQKLISNPWEKLNTSLLRMVCFDDASIFMQQQPFEVRYALILSLYSVDHPMAITAPRFWSTNEIEVHSALQHVIQTGGEGIILRKPTSRYSVGRSQDLLKIKASHSDQEALVTKVNEDGSLLLQMPNQFTFVVAKKDCVLHPPAMKGDVVTFSIEFSRPHTASQSVFESLPIQVDSLPNAVVHRVRADVTWDDVVRDSEGSDVDRGRMAANVLHPSPSFKQDAHAQTDRNNHTMAEFSEKSASWRIVSTRRAFFDKFAIEKRMDSLNPVFWYNVSVQELSRYQKGYHQILSYHGGRLSRALLQLYPDIGLQTKHFKDQQSWKLEETRKIYFDQFAASKGMEPLNPNFWYNVTTLDLNKYNNAYQNISSYYGGKMYSTLIQIYPSIGLQKKLFKVQSWKHKSDRKEYFDDFAAFKGMDSLNPVFWYGVTTYDLDNYRKVYQNIAKYYGGGLCSVLMQLYPDIGLQRKLFKGPSAHV